MLRAAVDLGRAYPAIVRELGIDPEVAARLRAGALAAAAGNAVALRATLAFSAGGQQTGRCRMQGHTVERLDAAAGHLLGHRRPGPEPLYITPWAQCCRSLEQISSVCDGLAALDLVDRSSQLAMQRTLVDGDPQRWRPTAGQRASQAQQAFYRFLKTTRVRPGRASGAIWRTRLGGTRQVAAAPAAAIDAAGRGGGVPGGGGLCNQKEPLELLPWAAVAAAALIHRDARPGSGGRLRLRGHRVGAGVDAAGRGGPALTSVELQGRSRPPRRSGPGC